MEGKKPEFNQKEKSSDVITETECLNAGESKDFTPNESELLFVTEGLLLLAKGRQEAREVASPSMLLLPVGEPVILRAQTVVRFITIHLCFNIPLSEQFYDLSARKNGIRDEKKTVKNTNDLVLPVNWVIQTFLKGLELYISAGLSSFQYLELKMKELAYLLEVFYEEDELRDFFKPILSRDRLFSDFILRSYHKAKSVTELAELSCYSFSGFESKFRKVFGMPASRWLKQKRATDIYLEICKGEKTFKQISSEYGFCSQANFNDFCRVQLGNTPGKLRKQRINRIVL